MPKLLWNVLKISGGANAPNAPLRVARLLWAIMIWMNTGKPKFYRERDFNIKALSCNGVRTETFSLNRTDIENCLCLHVLYTYFAPYFKHY